MPTFLWREPCQSAERLPLRFVPSMRESRAGLFR